MNQVSELCEDHTYNNLMSPLGWNPRKEIHLLLICSEDHHWQFLLFHLMAFGHSIGYRIFFTKTLSDHLTHIIGRVIKRVAT